MEKKRGKRSKPMEDGVWDCSVCTFKNSAEAFKCAMCDVRKGTSTRKPKPNPQLVAQQVAQQLVTVPKKPALKRVAERVDLGSDTSQDSHRSDTRDGEPGFSKASLSAQTVNNHLPHQQATTTPSVLPSTSRCEASKPVDNQARVTDFVALGNRRHPQQQFGEPHNKSFSSVRQNNNHPSQSNGNGFAYPFFMDITVNGLTVRIEERDPKIVNPRQNSTQRTKRRKTLSNLTPAVGPADVNNAVQVSGRASDCSSLDGSVVSESNAERTSDRTTTETTATHRAEQAVTPPGEDAVGSLPPSQPPTSTSLLPQRQPEVVPEVCN